jgi:hypothetical protein
MADDPARLQAAIDYLSPYSAALEALNALPDPPAWLRTLDAHDQDTGV